MRAIQLIGIPAGLLAMLVVGAVVAIDEHILGKHVYEGVQIEDLMNSYASDPVHKETKSFGTTDVRVAYVNEDGQKTDKFSCSADGFGVVLAKSSDTHYGSNCILACKYKAMTFADDAAYYYDEQLKGTWCCCTNFFAGKPRA